MKKTSFYLARAGLIGAIYVVLTLALPFIGFGPIQFRVGEAMCILPVSYTHLDVYKRQTWIVRSRCAIVQSPIFTIKNAVVSFCTASTMNSLF